MLAFNRIVSPSGSEDFGSCHGSDRRRKSPFTSGSGCFRLDEEVDGDTEKFGQTPGLGFADRAKNLDDLRIPPGNRLELLRGDRAGQRSIRVNDPYRICFRWDRGDAFEVELTDYH